MNSKRQSKAGCAPGMLCTTPLGAFRDWECGDSAPAQKRFDAEGKALELALTKSFRIRNEAIKSRKRGIGPVPAGPNEGVASQFSTLRSSYPLDFRAKTDRSASF